MGMTTSAAQQSSTASESVRVLVVDDHRTVADAVALALSGQDGLECVGTAHTVTEARSLALTTVPDVVVMDVDLGPAGSTDGIDVAAELVQSIVGIRVIILTAFVDQALLGVRSARAPSPCSPRTAPSPSCSKR